MDPFTLDNVSSRSYVCSRHEPPNLSNSASWRVGEMLLNSATPALEHSLSIKDNLEDLRIFVRNRATSFHAPSHWSEAICSLSTILLASTWSPNCSEHQIPCTFWTTRDSPIQLFTHIRCSSVDNTELIDGNALSSSPQKWKDNFPFPSHYKHRIHGIRDVHFHWSWSPCPQRRDPFLHSACTCGFRTISFLIHVQEMTNVRARIKNSYFLTMQCRCTLTWRWFVLGNAQVHTLFQLSCS